MTDLAHYAGKFMHLRRDHVKDWPSTTRGKSPYKPLLLLAVLDQFEQGQILANLIELTPDLGNLFDLYCAAVLPPGAAGSIAMPFFHLEAEGFWHLVPLPGREAHVQSGRRLITESQLVHNVAGARLDEPLYTLLTVKESRDVLRAALIDANFSAEAQPGLWNRFAVNQEAFLYSNQLLAQARAKIKEAGVPLDADSLPREVRDQGFRRAVVQAYSHRCASCGLRIMTPGGHTAVQAAHIVPWNKTRNDHPTNGLALCPLCHWSFDEGLLCVSDDYRIVLSRQLSEGGNTPGHLSTLADRSIFLPREADFYPDPEFLSWRIKHIFRKV